MYIREFESFYFCKRPKFSSKFIRILLLGDERFFTTHGIIALISEIKTSYVSALSAASLLAKLIDYEKNCYAENYIKEMVKMDFKTIQLFNLEAFICHESGQKSSALKIL